MSDEHRGKVKNRAEPEHLKASRIAGVDLFLVVFIVPYCTSSFRKPKLIMPYAPCVRQALSN